MRVAKWGNSLAVRLPSAVVETLGLKEGSEIAIHVINSKTFAVGKDRSRQQALAKLRKLRKPLPAGFSFDRDASHER